MTMLTFKYSKPALAILCAGFLVVAWLCFALPASAIYLLSQTTSALDGLFMGALGLAIIYLFFVLLRTWYAYFSIYAIEDTGIEVRCGSSRVFLPWHKLVGARYRRALAHIDLRFEGYSRHVVLTNVDLNMGRARILAALKIIDTVVGRPILRTWL